MPLYEYRCNECALVFEELIYSGDPQVGCPRCKAKNVARQLSVFASPAGTSGPVCADGDGACSLPAEARPAGCCGGSCGCH
jgi:putative FmdB family regulatory protein